MTENEMIVDYIEKLKKAKKYISPEETEILDKAFNDLFEHETEIYKGEEFFKRGNIFENKLNEISEKHFNVETQKYDSFYEEEFPVADVINFYTNEKFSGKNPERAAELRKKLIKNNLIQPEDNLYLINEEQIEKLGAKLINKNNFVNLMCPPDSNHSDFYEKTFYPITSVDKRDILKAYAAEKEIQLPESYNDYYMDLPNFAMITQTGLKQFSNYSVININKASDVYILNNGDSTISLPGETVRQITKQEPNTVKVNNVNYENIIDNQYNDFFKLRTPNNAANYIHNFQVICRTQANSPLDAFKIAKDMVNMLPEKEKIKCEKLLNNTKSKDIALDNYILKLFNEAMEARPLNEDYIKLNQPRYYIPQQYHDYISKEGQQIDDSSSLKIGDTIKNVPLKAWKVFNNTDSSKKQLIYKDLTLCFASKEKNLLIMKDKDNRYYELPRDIMINKYENEQKMFKKYEHQTVKKHDMSFER